MFRMGTAGPGPVLCRYLRAHCLVPMPPSLLILTDFFQAANRALDYATNLARPLGARAGAARRGVGFNVPPRQTAAARRASPIRGHRPRARRRGFSGTAASAVFWAAIGDLDGDLSSDLSGAVA